MPSDTFSHTTTVGVPPRAVDAALQDPATWEGLGPIEEVGDAAHDGDTLMSFRWRARAAGRTWEGTALRTAGEQGRSVTLDLDSPEIGGAITIDLEPVGSGSGLTVTLHARSKGLLAGMFWGVVSDAIGSGLPRQVDEFGDRF